MLNFNLLITKTIWIKSSHFFMFRILLLIFSSYLLTNSQHNFLNFACVSKSSTPNLFTSMQCSFKSSKIFPGQVNPFFLLFKVISSNIYPRGETRQHSKTLKIFFKLRSGGMGKFLLKNINQPNDNAHYSLKIVHNLVIILTILTKYQSKLATLNNKETYHLTFQKNFILIS